MKVLGIDIGSRSVKIVVFNDGKMKDNRIIDTSIFYREFCKHIDGTIRVDFDKLGIKDADRIISTGYGRNNVNVDGSEKIVELKAHTLGAVWQTGLKDFTLLDMGGQDSKIISVINGRMSDMILNDKCAASCGRYLENMSHVLDITLEELVKHYQKPVELSSTCAVFGESELIGRISEGYPVERLAAGVNYSLFKRIKPLMERFPCNTLVVTGGVAKNYALISYVKHETCFKNIVVPSEPQLNGAIGCCAYCL